MENKSLCIPTLDPRSTAGVRSVTEFLYELAEESGLNPSIIFNSVSWDECVTIGDLFHGSISPDYQSGEFFGMTGVRIGRRFPEVRVLNYLSNIGYWNRALENGDMYFGVGGPALSCFPLAVNDLPFGCWIGTTIYDEQQSQLNQLSPFRRFRDKATLPVIVRYERFTLKRANIVITQSSYTKRRIKELYDIPDEKIKVIPYPIDTKKFKPDSSNLNTSNILFIGRLNDPRKNTELLIEAFSKVSKSVPNATLTLVGQEPSTKLKSKCKRLGVCDSVSFKGRVQDIVPYLNNAAVFALPSKQEGLGIVGLEAMACRTPVVATQCGGPEDYVIDGETGVLVPQADSDEMATALIRILTNEQYREELGESARNLIEDKYAKEEIKHQFLDIFKKIEKYKNFK